MNNKIENIRKTIEATEREWRELGFYYDFDKKFLSWNIYGSKSGISKFAKLIEEYSNNPRNNIIYEHDHYGPSMFLKIITLEEPEINDNAIGGSLSDLLRLSEIIKNKIKSANVGDKIIINEEYGNSNNAFIRIEIMDDDFDVISLDEWIRDKKKEINY